MILGIKIFEETHKLFSGNIKNENLIEAFDDRIDDDEK